MNTKSLRTDVRMKKIEEKLSNRSAYVTGYDETTEIRHMTSVLFLALLCSLVCHLCSSIWKLFGEIAAKSCSVMAGNLNDPKRRKEQ